MGFLSRPSSAAWAGLVISAVVLAFWVAENDGDLLGLASFLLRFAHIAAAILWIGMIWFVNFIQLVALGKMDNAVRGELLHHVALPVAALFRVASHVVVLSGAGLLLTTGYLLDRWVFPSAVYIPSMRAALIWCGSLAAIVMWALVHFVVWPNLKLLVEGAGVARELDAAREKVRLAARVNLLLAIPVTFAMVAAAHLY
jgi:uncharacterized membrane protein